MSDFNSHIGIDNGSLSSAFISLLDSIIFYQCVHKPAHCFNHTLYLVLLYGIAIDHLIIFAYYPFCQTSTCLPPNRNIFLPLDYTEGKYKGLITLALDSMPYIDRAEDSLSDLHPSLLTVLKAHCKQLYINVSPLKNKPQVKEVSSMVSSSQPNCGAIKKKKKFIPRFIVL